MKEAQMGTEVKVIGGYKFYAEIEGSNLKKFGITRKNYRFPIPSVTDTMKVLLEHWNEAEDFLATVRSKLSKQEGMI